MGCAKVPRTDNILVSMNNYGHGNVFYVNPAKRTCTCRFWEVFGKPVWAAIRGRFMEEEEAYAP